jgi:hydrogenase-4 component F
VSVHGAVDADEALHWSVLVRAADGLEPAPLRLAIGLVVVGYGTKAGLAPLHSWLPDAYSQAPAPVAGLMSGAVSAMSMYALFRFKVIADLVIGDAFVRRLLIVAALSSLVVAASLMVTQRDFKRLLAYSSVEHVGLVALAAAVGSPLAMSAALLHLVGNGLVKAVTFSVTGEITFFTGTSRISDARGLLRRQPVAGTLFALGIVALAGLPPFSILASEVALVRAGVDDGLTWVIAVALAVMLVIFTALVVHTLDLLTGPGDLLTGPGDPSTGPILDSEPAHVTTLAARAPLAAGLAVAAVIGVTIWPISRLLHSAAEVLAK